MPWHGQVNSSNARVTWRLFCERQHPAGCKDCASIWGEAGAPRTFEDYVKRYTPLERGQKRHLTRVWSPGISFQDLAKQTDTSERVLHTARRNGMFEAVKLGGTWFVTKTDATLWETRGCPTGSRAASWVSVPAAVKTWGFSAKEIKRYIAEGRLVSKLGDAGAQRGQLLVSKRQISHLRDVIGFTEAEAARRAGVTVPQLRHLLKGASWRVAKDGGIPLEAVRTAIKRRESANGLTIEQAAADLCVALESVQEHIQNGTVRLSTTRWEPERPYLTAPMMTRLRKALESPPKVPQPGDDWLTKTPAALLVGVSQGTVMSWAEQGLIRSIPSIRGARYQVEELKAHARQYWPTQRFKRATPPAWLAEEWAAATQPQ